MTVAETLAEPVDDALDRLHAQVGAVLEHRGPQRGRIGGTAPVVDVAPVGGVVEQGELGTEGIELEMLWRPTDSTEIQAHYAHNEGEYDEFEGGTCWDTYLFHFGGSDPGSGGDPDAEVWPARVPDLYSGEPVVVTARATVSAPPVLTSIPWSAAPVVTGPLLPSCRSSVSAM